MLKYLSHDLYTSKDSMYSRKYRRDWNKISNSLRLPWECRHFLDVCSISRSTSLSTPQQSHRLSRGRSLAILSDKFRNGWRECVADNGRNNKLRNCINPLSRDDEQFLRGEVALSFCPLVILRPFPARRKGKKIFPQEQLLSRLISSVYRYLISESFHLAFSTARCLRLQSPRRCIGVPHRVRKSNEISNLRLPSKDQNFWKSFWLVLDDWFALRIYYYFLQNRMAHR